MKTRVLSLLLIVALCATMFLCSCGSSNFTLNNDSVSLTVGETYKLTTSSTNSKVTWSTSNQKVATVDNGKITALSSGKAVISAMTSSGAKATCDVTVESVEVKTVKLDKNQVTIEPNGSFQLDAVVYPKNASKDLDWSSSDESVAIVDDTGLVNTIKSGSAIIKCYTSNGKSASCSVKVRTRETADIPSVTTESTTTAETDPIQSTTHQTAVNSVGSILYCRADIWVSLRKVPNKDAGKIDKVKSLESVTYLSTAGDFYYVDYQGKEGYVLSDYFTPDPDAKRKTTIYCQASEFVTLRRRASTNAAKILEIKRNESAIYLGTAGDFYYVVYNGERGYVLKSYFTEPEEYITY